MPLPTLNPSETHTGVLRQAQARALGSYRHDIPYTGALKSMQAHALGSYRHDIPYTGALKSTQHHALGSYRHDIPYTGALKSDLKRVIFRKQSIRRAAYRPGEANQ